jgi:predicted nucleotidyltransferase
MLLKAEKIAGFLSLFPFVRGVSVSGSLSKNFADEDSDIDFFIITAKNRLWIARTFMHLFKKLTFLAGKQHWFCMNYYVSEDHMEIKEKNLYTAIEVATLMPLRGISVSRDFIAQNNWSQDFLPNHSLRVSHVEEIRNPFFKKCFEFLFSGRAADALDRALMRYTSYRWGKKQDHKQLNSHGNVMGMDTDRHYAKPNPVNFQVKLLAQYERKVQGLVRRFERRIKSIHE